MKRLLLLLLTLPLLAGCGSVSAVPTAGELLDAPTTLNMNSKLLSAAAWPTLSGSVLTVKVKIEAAHTALPPLNLTNIYVVTNDGVWSSAVIRPLKWKCGPGCLLAQGSGPAGELQPNSAVQLVIGLRDPQGRLFLLRDSKVRFTRP